MIETLSKGDAMSTSILHRSRAATLLCLLAALFLLLCAGQAMAYPASTTADLNMRSGPGTQYRVIATIPRGGRVEVINCSRGWCDLIWSGRRGYASARFLSRAVAPGTRGGVPPRVGGSFEIIIPFPGIQPPPRYRPAPPHRDWRHERPRRAECTERGLRRFLGERAARHTVARARERSRARSVRVVRPGDFITRDYRHDRLTIEVDRRHRIVDLRCY
ncbi:I78 family peptidase inhibitor [Saliniramus sp.]|uniref:I78 family peptidase inhibitor n=1 Tax=Saliniramus sp. TaxID=2986772 RepID=UPI002C09A049|nr:I78 family peptidase inhibitor [Saliniramus sp.]HMB10789.1 I78 family peptidase inhibitor [Saliniramus sp.]